MSQYSPVDAERRSYVDLDRHFHEFTKEELADEELLAAYNEEHSWHPSLSWDELLKRKRIVVLASAGSGKTEEMEQRKKKLESEQKHAFYVRLEELGQDGFVDLLKPDERQQFHEWQSTPSTPAWFFLDSVDELKLTQRTLESAFRHLTQVLHKDLHRAHIIVSSRPTDWRPASDETKFREWLPLPAVLEENQASGEEVFLAALSRRGLNDHESRKTSSEAQDQRVTTVLLLPFAERHIKNFARQWNVTNPDQFFQEITKNNAWSFARRPLDLIELISMWNSKGRLGTKQDQHLFNVEVKLKDSPDRRDAGLLSSAQAEDGAERLALAMALTRKRAVKTPDQHVTVDSVETVLDGSVVLRGWAPDVVGALLRRAMFDPATFGRVRFHHRSVQEFLAARRLLKLRKKGMTVRAMFRLFFAEKYGEKVVIPSMRPIAAWLALWDTDVFRELVSTSPDVLIEHGDPGSLSIQQRASIIAEFVGRYRRGGWRGFQFPVDQLSRIASPELARIIKKSWGAGPENSEVRELLLELIGKGPVTKCAAIASGAAMRRDEKLNLRVDAIRALSACSAASQLKKIAKLVLSKPVDWPARLIATVLPELFPAHLTIDELLTLLQRHKARDLGEPSDGFEWALRHIINENPSHFDRSELRAKLARMIQSGAKRVESWHQLHSRFRSFCGPLALMCVRELELCDRRPGKDLIESCAIAYHICGREIIGDEIKALHTWFEERTELRPEVFWIELALMDEVTLSEDSWDRFYSVDHRSMIGSIRVSDRDWVEVALRDDSNTARQDVALQAWINIWAMDGLKRRQLSAMHSSLRDNPRLLGILQKRTQKSKDSAKVRQYEAEAKRNRVKWAAKEKQRLLNWKSWRRSLKLSPEEHFTPQRVRGTIHNLFHWMSQHEAASSSHGVWNYQTLVTVFSRKVADLAKNAFMDQWRQTRPALWSERGPNEHNSTPYVWIYGLCGVMAEAEVPGWTKTLTTAEASLATRYATVEMNGFAPFIAELAKTRPVEVDQVLGTEVVTELNQGASHSYLPVLQNLTHADAALKTLLMPRLTTFLTTRRNFNAIGDQNHWHHNLDQLFGILRETVTETDSTKIGQFCIKQMKKSRKGSLPLIWLRGVFQFAPQQAPEVLVNWFKGNRDPQTKSLELQVIANLFGDLSGVSLQIKDHDQRAKALGKLIRLAYRIVRPEDDAVHEGSYAPDTRDDAERGRSVLLSLLLETPGFTAQQLIVELSNERNFRHFPDRLRQLASERAAKDAEFEAWTCASVAALDQSLEMPPKGRDEMFQLMIDRLGDLQHDLDNNDFSDRRTLQTIRDETEMQRSIAQKLQAMGRDAYALDREPEVADRKKPDIRLRSNADGTKTAIEIKIADNGWSLMDLEKALKTQLVRQYLRHESCSAGCLLLTFSGKNKRWKLSPTKWLNFAGLVAHLNQLARKIETQSKGQIRVSVVGLLLNGR